MLDFVEKAVYIDNMEPTYSFTICWSILYLNTAPHMNFILR